MNFLLSLPVWAQILVLLVGLACLWAGSELVIKGATDISRRFGLSELVIGLTVVSMGSSAPEMWLNFSSGLRGDTDLGLGNIIGSCLSQISLILGLAVLLGGFLSIKPIKKSDFSSFSAFWNQEFLRDSFMMLFAIILLWIFGANGVISVWEGIVLVLIYVAYTYFLVSQPSEAHVEPEFHWVVAFLMVAFGIGLVYAGAESLITLGLHWGTKAGLSKAFIGILSGLGTALPELIISVTALMKKKAGISLGNLFGSNITDPMFSFTLGVFSGGGANVTPELYFRAIPAWFGLTVFAIVIFWVNKGLSKKGGLALIAGYLAVFFFMQ